MNYIPRLVDPALGEALASSGMVLIEGLRGCGKSETAKRYARSAVYLDRDTNMLAVAQLDPAVVLGGKYPRLIDEWQLAPALWNEARHQVDEKQERGVFIFTGSSSKLRDGSSHPGSARVRKLKMRTFSVQESKFSSAAYLLSELFKGHNPTSCVSEAVPLEALFEMLCVGGWPAYQGLSAGQALRLHRDYLQDVVSLDLKTLEGPSDPQVAKRLLTAIARSLGSKTPVSKLAAEVAGAGTPLKPQTAQAYISQFEALWITEEISAWVPHLRSRYSVNQSAKRYFGDASLAVSALSANPANLIKDLKTAGFLFENFVITNLLTFMDALEGTVRHYRDESGLEIDAILEDNQGRWGAVEIKLGFNAVEAAASQLLKFASRVDTSVVGEASFLAVITNSSSSYRRADGVHVISISHIGR